ncbi:MAG: transposase [bacterium]|nr:transposase [bacterium]
MANRAPLAPNEWYHCYNRGVDKRVVFKTVAGYERFLAILFLCNGDKTVHLSNRVDTNLQNILLDPNIDRGEPLVDIAAYSLMPNHVHLVLRSSRDGGIARFMQKVFTAYTMYFNKRQHRTGALFAGTYKSKHVYDDRYLKRLIPYIVLNAADLVEPRWREHNATLNQKKLLQYPYASLPDFLGVPRPEGKIINTSIHEYYETIPSLDEMIAEARLFYRENEKELRKLT